MKHLKNFESFVNENLNSNIEEPINTEITNEEHKEEITENSDNTEEDKD